MTRASPFHLQNDSIARPWPPSYEVKDGREFRVRTLDDGCQNPAGFWQQSRTFSRHVLMPCSSVEVASGLSLVRARWHVDCNASRPFR